MSVFFHVRQIPHRIKESAFHPKLRGAGWIDGRTRSRHLMLPQSYRFAYPICRDADVVGLFATAFRFR